MRLRVLCLLVLPALDSRCVTENPQFQTTCSLFSDTTTCSSAAAQVLECEWVTPAPTLSPSEWPTYVPTESPIPPEVVAQGQCLATKVEWLQSEMESVRDELGSCKARVAALEQEQGASLSEFRQATTTSIGENHDRVSQALGRIDDLQLHIDHLLGKFNPTQEPTAGPTRSPLLDPTAQPTDPTQTPSSDPTGIPTEEPTDPTRTPTNAPTRHCSGYRLLASRQKCSNYYGFKYVDRQGNLELCRSYCAADPECNGFGYVANGMYTGQCMKSRNRCASRQGDGNWNSYVCV